jgi:hypothetical protein
MMRSILAGYFAILVASVAGIAVIAWPAIAWPVQASHLIGLSVLVLCYAYPIALAHALIIAAPIYAVMMIARWPVRWWNAALVAVVTGAGPIFAFAAVWLPGPLLAGDFDGGWGSSLLMVEFGGGCGLVGGLVFRAVRGPDPGDAEPLG